MTPDRFSKIARPVTKEDVIDLLKIGRRLELNAVVRLVKKFREETRVQSHPIERSDTCDDILAALDARRKGR